MIRKNARADFRWALADTSNDLANQLAQNLRISPVTAKLLVNRNISGVEQAKAFLYPDLNKLHNPNLLPDCSKAVQRIDTALRNKEKIVIYGDYDVDGITGTAILYKFLKILQANVSFYIPDRQEEGYGLNIHAIEKLKNEGVALLITVDSGTVAFEQIAFAKANNVDAIVCDHHEPVDKLPEAYAILNPKLKGSCYPFDGITAAVVAFKLAWAISEKLSLQTKESDGFKSFIVEAIVLSSIGMIADVAPLVDENRVIAFYGLRAIKSTSNFGLKELIEVSGDSDKTITPYEVAYHLAPRLNASGRISTARVAMELFTADSKEKAKGFSDALQKDNEKRQDIEGAILKEAKGKVEKEVNLQTDYVIVLESERWHSGVVGIVSAKIVEEYSRPAAIIAVKGKQGRGSVRSVKGFNVAEALASCNDLLIGGGGHYMAGGFDIKAENIGKFRERFNRIAQNALKGVDLTPQLFIDCRISLDEINTQLLKEIKLLEPFGVGNKKPLFTANDVKVIGEPKIMGKNSNHIQFYVGQGGFSHRTVGFYMGEIKDKLKNNAFVDIAFEADLNQWNGKKEVNLYMKDIKFK